MKVIEQFDNDFNGVIHYLQAVYRGKASQLVNIQHSSQQISSNEWGPSQSLINYSLVKAECQSNWCSESIENSNFTIKFTKHSIDITRYTFITRNILSAEFPMNWKVEGSNDDVTWEYIDHRLMQTDMSEVAKKKTYEVLGPGRYKYFRFVHNGTNSDGHWHFCLGKVDIFGKLYGVNDTCRQSYKRKESKLYILLLILTSSRS